MKKNLEVWIVEYEWYEAISSPGTHRSPGFTKWFTKTSLPWSQLNGSGHQLKYWPPEKRPLHGLLTGVTRYAAQNRLWAYPGPRAPRASAWREDGLHSAQFSQPCSQKPAQLRGTNKCNWNVCSLDTCVTWGIFAFHNRLEMSHSGEESNESAKLHEWSWKFSWQYFFFYKWTTNV